MNRRDFFKIAAALPIAAPAIANAAIQEARTWHLYATARHCSWPGLAAGESIVSVGEIYKSSLTDSIIRVEASHRALLASQKENQEVVFSVENQMREHELFEDGCPFKTGDA